MAPNMLSASSTTQGRRHLPVCGPSSRNPSWILHPTHRFSLLLFIYFFSLTLGSGVPHGGHYTVQLDGVNQIGDEYLDRIGKLHSQLKKPQQKDELKKKQPGDKEEQLKPLRLNPNKNWENPQGPTWPRLKIVTQPGTGDLLLHARPQGPANRQPNMNDVADANYAQKSLRLKEHLKTVQLADVEDRPQPNRPVGAILKGLGHASYPGDVNAAAVPNPHTRQPAKPEVTSKNPRSEKQQQKVDNSKYVPMYDVYFIAIVAGCSVAGLVGIIVAAVCWYSQIATQIATQTQRLDTESQSNKLQKNVKAASDVDYPAYGVTGPTKDRLPSPGDRKLAQSAQMYHYQHQKQQMIALEKANGEMKHDATDDDSEEENEEGDYTVYECPGLAPTGEMEVKNPLFNDDSSQMTTSGTELTNGLPQPPTLVNGDEEQVGLPPQ